MPDIHLNIAETFGIAAFVLILGEFIRARVPLLARYFIPGPVIGGVAFSLFTLAGHDGGLFILSFDDQMQAFLLLVFFTTIGFSASFALLKQGGLAVVVFLAITIALVLLQNLLGVGLARALGENPLLGLAVGSVSLIGGHGTSAAFAPLLEQAGLAGAMPAAMASATWGLIAAGALGGPLGKLLMQRHGLQGRPHGDDEAQTAASTGTPADKTEPANGALHTVILVACAIGTGSLATDFLARLGLTLPAYLGPMLVAAVMRNLIDWRRGRLPARQLGIIGEVSLSFFLAMALMSMRLWELEDLAGPLLVILLAQTALVPLYAYFVTFRVMGRNYDATVMAAGHCGGGLGAVPNAMANMQSFTAVFGPSPEAFFVVPLVGSLFIDFFNAVIITAFMHTM